MTPRRNVVFVLAFLSIAIIFGAAILIQTLLNSSKVSDATILEIISNPTTWENRIVIVDGRMQKPSLGIILPFNYWLCDAGNQTIRIGVKLHSETDLSGKRLTVVGVVKRGYSWVHPNYSGWWVYFIEANSICEIA